MATNAISAQFHLRFKWIYHQREFRFPRVSPRVVHQHFTLSGASPWTENRCKKPRGNSPSSQSVQPTVSWSNMASLLVWFTVELQDPKRATTGCCRWASSGAISFKAALCVWQQKLCYRRPQFHSSLLTSKKVPQLLPSKKSVSLPSRQICFRNVFRGRNPLASVQRQLLNYLYKVRPEVQPRDTPWTPQSIILEEQRQRNESDTNSKLQHFIAALAKVRFLKLVKIGRHFCMKCYNFTSLSSYMQKPKNSGKKNFKRARKKKN